MEPISLATSAPTTFRDPKDNPFLACALAVRAKFLVTRDDDLLDLGKLFGIEMITLAKFLSWLREG